MVHLTLHATAFPALRPSPGATHAGRVYKAAWLPGDGEVLACATDKGGKMWDMESGGTGLKLFGTNTKISDMAWSGDGLLLATVGEETVVWKSDGTRLITLQFKPQVEKESIRCPKFNNSGRLLAVQEYKRYERLFHVFDVVTGACLKTVSSRNIFGIVKVSFAWKNQLEFYCDGRETITLHKVGQDRPIQVLTSRLLITNLLFNEESGVLAAGGGFGVELWNPSQQTPTSILNNSIVVSMAWHPQNSTVLAGSFTNGRVEVWDTVTRMPLHILKVYGWNLWYGWNDPDISFSTDGRFLAANDENVSVWNVSTGDLVAVCKTEEGNPIQVGWNPNYGNKVAVNMESSVSVFNLENIARMTLRTLSTIRVAECLEMNIKNGRGDAEKLFRQQEVPQILVEEINSYLGFPQKKVCLPPPTLTSPSLTSPNGTPTEVSSTPASTPHSPEPTLPSSPRNSPPMMEPRRLSLSFTPATSPTTETPITENFMLRRLKDFNEKGFKEREEEPVTRRLRPRK